MKGRVAFILYLYPLGVSSMIINSIKMFASKGISVDVFVDKSTNVDVPVEFAQEKIKVHSYEDSRSIPLRALLFVHFWIGRLVLPLLTRFNAQVPLCFLHAYYARDAIFSKWLKSKIETAEYDYLFPVEAKSLIAVTGSKNPIIYYNMELLDWSEENPIYGKDKILVKRLEFAGVSGLSAVVIQNQKRAEQFRRINHFDRTIFHLPVASMGESIREKGSFFRDKYKIAEDISIVVYSGNIMPWAKCSEIVDNVKHWPSRFCLVLHTWRRDAFEADYGREVKEISMGLPVYLSNDYLDIEELPVCLSSADVALMFYEPIDANFSEILFSSNKLAEYLKAGLPVITYDSPELKKFFATHGIGETVSTIDEIPSALRKIMNDYSTYSKNVEMCYEDVFRFENHFAPMYERLCQ